MIRNCVIFPVISLIVGIASIEAEDTPELTSALDRAGANRSEIEKALRECPKEQQDGMQFLVANMPDRDLTSLSAEFLLENSELAWKALKETPWANSIPQDVAFDSLLPYANISERRDRWRKDFYEQFRPLTADAKTPAEAAALLNQTVFPKLNVKYSTGRKKADQSPYESMESGLASCTGLSVLLVDACRAVGVPARIVGTPLWSDKSGNHTWVEIWDNGWHFTGACEPSGNQLDQAWFVDRASQAQRDERLHAIYAVTFRRNGQPLPMVWASEVHDVFAVNVTDRYTARKQTPPDGHAIVRFRVLSADSKSRVAADLSVKDAQGTVVFQGTTKDERFDSNDHLTATLMSGAELTAEAIVNGVTLSQAFRVELPEQLVSVLTVSESDKSTEE